MKKKDFIDELESQLSPERVSRARNNAKKEIFKISLSELRKNSGIRQEDNEIFSQSSISKLESRKDIKISTLIDYLDSIGMGIEIKVYPKKTKNRKKEVTLLKS